MKLKKIKNYILTFIVCLLGAFAFNVIETKAVGLIGDITANEGDVYFYDFDTSNQKSIYFLASPNFNATSSNNSLTKINVVYNSFSSNTTYTAVYGNCKLDTYVANNFLQFSCTGRHIFSSDNTQNNYVSGDTAIFAIQSNINNTWQVGARLVNSGNTYSYTFTSNVSDEYTEGYENGYENGYNLGYEEGYDTAETSQNSLVGMVGAIFTGPVTMFQEIFNFNVLGINFAEMLLGLVTLLVVIWLIKKFI